MDRSLDEIINERPVRISHVAAVAVVDQEDVDLAETSDLRAGTTTQETVYTKRLSRHYSLLRIYEAMTDRDIPTDRRAPRDFRDDGYDRRYEPSPDTRSTPAAAGRLRVDDLHYDIREDEIKELFGRIGPVESVRLLYDRQDRSQGTAYVNYTYAEDARAALREFDGANAYGQPIRLQMMPPPAAPKPARNPFDYVEKPSRSLFDRIETSEDAPPGATTEAEGGTAVPAPTGDVWPYLRSIVTFPEAEAATRVLLSVVAAPRVREVADQAREGRTLGRPRKTADELDAEMDDYFNTSGNAGQDAAAPRAHDSGAREPQVATINQGENPMGGATGTMEDDIDLMVE
ncbi:hypothetical protein H2203_004278 [Taxawa tesnikishii (nom. ined.)]|nr:hypothetical protein H2203_004278 [Dothideales sp. JES 119]